VLIFLPASEVGGAMLTEDSIAASATDRKFVGSVMIFEASSIEEVKKAIYEDVYYTSKVVSNLMFYALIKSKCAMILQWDHDKLVILPFLSAAPLP
jgi:uncharacterized protein